MDQELPKIHPRSAEEIATYEEQERKRITLEILGRANFPRTYAPNQLERYSKHEGWRKAFDEVLELLRKHPPAGDFGALIAIIGFRGTGKTALGVEVMRATAHKHMFVYYANLLACLQRLRFNNEPAQTQEDYWDPALLVLDEAGVTPNSKREEDEFSRLVDERQSNQKHTILIAPARLSDLDLLFTPSIRERLNTPKTSKVIHLDWESLR